MSVSFLDQSPVFDGESHRDALQNTLETVRSLDGYCKRFWFSEHHGAPFYASASPDIMMGQAAAMTQSIELGAGGILLRNHNPLLVAERFSLLEALYPGRINLGIGMATGANDETEQVLCSSSGPECYEKLEQLKKLRANENPKVPVAPYSTERSPLWILGKSPYMATYAAQRGLPYVHGSFINQIDEEPSLESYKRAFQSESNSSPYLVWAIFALTADSDAEAVERAAPYKKWFAEFYHRQQFKRFSRTDEAVKETLSESELDSLERSGRMRFIGERGRVIEEIVEMKRRYNIDEIMIVSINESIDQRINCAKQISDALKNS